MGFRPVNAWLNFVECVSEIIQEIADAHARFHTVALRESARLRLARRMATRDEIPLSGAHGVATLIKADVLDRYSVRIAAHAQIPMVADRIDEPPFDSPIVSMLDALPPE